MDSVLLEYLRSGKAWLLVGSGPSTAMGYPSSKALASTAVQMARGVGSVAGSAPFARDDYAAVFDEVADVVGLGAMIQTLRASLVSQQSESDIYRELARWPIPVYLTTNYDDELQRHLASIDSTYRLYSNSEDHLSLLVPGFAGAVVKLHGDLTSSDGRIFSMQVSNTFSGSTPGTLSCTMSMA